MGHITSCQLSVNVVTRLMGWDAKVSGHRTWVMGPKHLLAELLPEYPAVNWRRLPTAVVEEEKIEKDKRDDDDDDDASER